MNIYFSASIRGGRQEQPAYKQIVELLQKYGTVVSEHVADETISDYGETDHEKEELHDREIESLKTSDVFVAEVTMPSLGVGYTIAKALELGKKVICLYHGEHTDKLSAMIKGNSKVRVFTYGSGEDLAGILWDFFVL